MREFVGELEKGGWLHRVTNPVEGREATGKEIDLYRFPTPHWHPLDGGRFIGTLGVVIAKDPETGKGNTGIYREQILDRDKVGLGFSWPPPGVGGSRQDPMGRIRILTKSQRGAGKC